MPIPASRVNRNNTNLRKHDDPLWRDLRKLRFKPAKPDPYTNEMAAEEMRRRYDGNADFDHDVDLFIEKQLSPREGKIFWLFVYGGKITQAEIASTLGVCQGTIALQLAAILKRWKEFYYE